MLRKLLYRVKFCRNFIMWLIVSFPTMFMKSRKFWAHIILNKCRNNNMISSLMIFFIYHMKFLNSRSLVKSSFWRIRVDWQPALWLLFQLKSLLSNWLIGSYLLVNRIEIWCIWVSWIQAFIIRAGWSTLFWEVSFLLTSKESRLQRNPWNRSSGIIRQAHRKWSQQKEWPFKTFWHRF